MTTTEQEWERKMAAEAKAVIGGAITGIIVADSMALLFGVLDIQCRGTDKPNWNAQIGACE